MRTPTIAIIGGGPGGLMAAYFLQKYVSVPVRISLFEASDRLGGKILTLQFHAAHARYEAGAAEFYDYSPVDHDPLKELVAELGLSINPMGGSAVIINQHILGNLDDVREHLGPQVSSALTLFDRQAKDRMTPQEFYHSDEPLPLHVVPQQPRFDTYLANLTQPTRHYVENLIHSDLATEPQNTSLEYGLQNYLMNDPAYMRLYSIEGGNERLPRELAARLQADMRLNHQVTAVAKVGEQLQVTFRSAAGVQATAFDFVVVALPHNGLSGIAFQGDRLSVAMSEHISHYNHPAHYLRITILFDRPFWRGKLTDSYCMLDRFGGCCLYDESSREPGAEHSVLGWLLGGEQAQSLSNLTDEQLVAEALASLPEFLAHGREFMVEGRVHRWIGAINAIPGGIVRRSLDRRHQPEPNDHAQLFVVGDYLYDATLNGVLDSADYVANWIAALLAERC